MPNYNVPALIQQWIDALNHPSTPEHIKENYVMMLDNLKEACDKEVSRYRSMKLKMPEKKPRKTRVAKA